MIKLGLATVALSVLLLSGCGGGSKSKSITEEISERDNVVIIHGANLAFCELMKNFIIQTNEAKDIITDLPVNTVNCSTYNKVEDEDICVNESFANMLDLTDTTDTTDIAILQDEKTACVIGLNQK